MASQEYATQKTSIDAQALINDAPISKYQWLIAIVCFLIVFVDGIDTAAMGFIAPALAQDWGIDRSQLGPVMSAALGGMIIGALVSGPTADRFGRKIVLSVSMLIFGGFTLASAYATDLNTLVVLRFLTGYWFGCCNAGMQPRYFLNIAAALTLFTRDLHVLWVQLGYGDRRFH